MERLFFESAIRPLLIAVASAAILRMFHVRRASARHAVWTGVLTVMLLLPLWSVGGYTLGLPVLPSIAPSAGPVGAGAIADAPLNVAPAGRQGRPRTRNATWSWWDLVLAIYALGALWLLTRLAIGTLRAKRLLAGAENREGVLTSDECAAPMTIGWLHPHVVLPQGWSEWPQVAAVQIDAVMTHELAHVRRRDPLVQWLAMFNRAVFWFHPLAWWLERTLASLAEESCDDAVLEQGYDPGAYAECLLAVERAVKSAGARVGLLDIDALGMAMPGSGLPHRVRLIFDGPRWPRVSRARRMSVALACSATAVLFGAGTVERIPAAGVMALPRAIAPAPPESALIAQATAAAGPAARPAADSLPEAARIEFEAASIKPVDLSANPTFMRGAYGGPGSDDPTRITYRFLMQGLLREAYGIQFDQISGPDWFGTDRFEIVANVPPGATKEQVNFMLRNLLADRFGLKFHWETKDFAAYELTVAKGGPKLKESVDVQPAAPRQSAGGARQLQLDRDGFPIVPQGSQGAGVYGNGGMRMTFRGLSIPELIMQLGFALGTSTGPNTYGAGRIVDHTGLTGRYDFTLEYAMMTDGIHAAALVDSEPGGAPEISEALEKQLGLKLEKRKLPLDVMVVDHADRNPVEN